jgi:hypothetical protein
MDLRENSETGKFRDALIRMTSKPQPKTGDMVTLTRLPAELLKGLPRKDQIAISKIIGTPILLVSYDKDGRAELKFTGDDGVVHFIYVEPSDISPVKKQ